MPAFGSWGRVSRPQHEILPLHWPDQDISDTSPANSALPYGNGRSYGDCCLNANGRLLWTRPLERFVRFDTETGLLRCETGITLGEILEVTLPRGWFLPVSPGTRYVTLGGAIANDVHGKNHHRAGSFGCHVRALHLQRSDGTQLECTPENNAGLFAASIGGLGLTGLMVAAEIQLKPVNNAFLSAESQRFESLNEFFSLSAESEESHEYTVAWIDSLAAGSRFGRGIFMRANHAPERKGLGRNASARQRLSIPCTPPFSPVQPPAMKLFNSLYYHRAPARFAPRDVHFTPFFYPLDGIAHWNRLYGPRGFFQFQCVVPHNGGETVISEVLHAATRSRQGSFLAVLKVFGNRRSPGMLSFPRPGITLALDFPNRGEKTRSLFRTLHQIVMKAGGAVYPAKDGLMPPELFEQSFPDLEEFRQYKDPGLNSDLWRRVTRET